MSLSVFHRQSMYSTACRSISGIASAAVRTGYSFHPPTPATVPSSSSSSLFPKAFPSNTTQVRYLNLHEYQSKDLMCKYGIRVQKGKVANNPTEAESIAKELLSAGAKELIVKAQIHAGGRGKGKFDNGFKGGVKITTVPSEVGDYSSKMLGAQLITHQTTAEGQPVHQVLVHEGIFFDRELYFAILMDRKAGGPVIVCSPQGGVDIEEVAAKTPDNIYYQAVDINKGIQSEHTDRLATLLGFTGQSHKDAQEQMVRLYNLFIGTDATQVEINPFVQTKDGYVYCVDAKINFDDNASFRHKELFALRDTSQEDPRDVVASDFGLNYIGLDGNIACMVNGAGLAMATMDIIKLHGGEPANFLDVGGGANEKQVEEAFKLLTSDKSVKAILVNIFGGIMKCDIIATGIINAARNLKLTVPLVVRLEGTNVEKGNQLLQASGLTIITAKDLDDAAKKAVKSAVKSVNPLIHGPSIHRRFFSSKPITAGSAGQWSVAETPKKFNFRVLIECPIDKMLGYESTVTPPIIQDLSTLYLNKETVIADIGQQKLYHPKYDIILNLSAEIVGGDYYNEESVVSFIDHLLILHGYFERDQRNLMRFKRTLTIYQHHQKNISYVDFCIEHRIDEINGRASYRMMVSLHEYKKKGDVKNEPQLIGGFVASAQKNLFETLPQHLLYGPGSFKDDEHWKAALIKTKASVSLYGTLCMGKTDAYPRDISTVFYKAKIAAIDLFDFMDGKPFKSNESVIYRSTTHLFFDKSNAQFFEALEKIRIDLHKNYYPIHAVDPITKEPVSGLQAALLIKKVFDEIRNA